MLQHLTKEEQALLAYDRVPVNVANDYLTFLPKNPHTLRILMQQGKIDIGIAMQHEGGRWGYYIQPERLIAYKHQWEKEFPDCQ